MGLELTVVREELSSDRTIGLLYMQGCFLGWTLEDTIRGMQHHDDTCIPPGRYKMVITRSKRFNRMLPILLNVPEHEGIRIHGGSHATETNGCILIGGDRSEDQIYNCGPVLEAVMANLAYAQASGLDSWIEIQNPTLPN